jgi:hypothetical protein
LSFLLAGALLVTIVGFLILIDRKDRRHVAQVTELCQRIQAPELATVAHWTAPRDEPAHLPFGDDAAWIAYQNGLSE